MRVSFLLSLLIFLHIISCGQTVGRIPITTIIPSENTGQDYSSWFNDDINNLVPNCWTPANFKYIDVTLELSGKSKVTKLSLYDYEGIFTDNPASVYARNGDQKTLIGVFTGELYRSFVELVPDNPVIADAIIIHKYCNNIPQKVQIYGEPYMDGGSGDGPANPIPKAVITFEGLPNKTMGDPPFTLNASSSNPQTPLNFSSSNPAVVWVGYVDGVWKAVPVSVGTATITVSQAGNEKFQAPADVSQSITVREAGSPTVIGGKIPIDPKRWFQLTNAANGLEALFDGKTDGEVHTGWGKILENYDSYYPVLDGEQIDLSGIRLYDGSSTFATQPCTLSVITREGQKITVATFTGSQYNTWVGPDPGNPGQFNLPNTFNSIRYLVINSWNNFPTEIEFYGNYTPGKAVAPLVKKSAPLRQMFGVNGFEWNFEAPNNPGQIDAASFRAAKSFTGFRHYMDWEKLELTQGVYSFNPTTSGGWNYDDLYDSCKAAGIEVLACLKTLPPWMRDTYPSDQRDAENVPVKWGKDFSDPLSYIEQAKVAFQYAARYGSNQNVDRSLLSVNTTPRWAGDHVNTIKVGLGSVRYIECENERDKWWKGRKAYQTAYEYAANLSAFYDGHKNTMGPGVGVKNADPSMQVVMAGTALATTDYLKGMIDWCRQHRGYNKDGSVNLCWDVINYHLYANDAKSSQNGNATRGAAPELSGTAETAAEFIQTAHLYASDMPVWVTELGYDINQGSPFKAIPIGGKSALQTQADWTLRSSLLYAKSGIERIFFYEMYDDNVNNPFQFSSSGLINADKTRKPAADYLVQANRLLGEYSYKESLSNDPVVDRYELNGKSIYAVYVADEKDRTALATIDVGSAAYVDVYFPRIGHDDMETYRYETGGGKYYIYARETPVFVVPGGNRSATQRAGSSGSLAAVISQEKFEHSIQLYPNPAPEFLHVLISNENYQDGSVRIMEAGSGKLVKSIQFKKPVGLVHQEIDIHNLPDGYYLVEIKQGHQKVVKNILKSSH
ncbi:MAG: T9SS type A sorting domain-containing protein [Williamsia sp.]|nr:T9SS type A sorting domain-containing protein [Williamsia sp.]